VEEIRRDGKGLGSLGAITEVVLRGMRGRWVVREQERTRERERREELEKEVVHLMREKGGEEDEEMEKEVEEVRRVFATSDNGQEEKGKRKVPDWLVDDISFNPMVDPVMVRLLSHTPTSPNIFIPLLLPQQFPLYLKSIYLSPYIVPKKNHHLTNSFPLKTDQNRQLLRTSLNNETSRTKPDGSPHARTPHYS